ncbi:alpha/beta fold hydrolase [Loktanella sp. Alg231-35]|uniref:alpha/beta fold hydrolase n=1 Tax=Loktanella sp. Alg231-35 TaxID=1922220 RepID=UPI000D559569|nr:alpha/beta hydrolase [Loktanella sp. Alg231-35]
MLNYHRNGTGQALVMQHGFYGGGGYFAHQAAALGHMYDVIAPDLPGFAGSNAVDAVSTIEALSIAQVGLLDELGIDKFHLLGHSMGGMVALQTALDHPDRVQKLVLYATNSSGNLQGRFETFDETKARVRAEGVDAVARKVTATWFAEYERAPMFQFCLSAGAGAARAAIEGALEAFQKWDVSHRLHELQMPVLVISGDKDRSYSVDGLVQLTKGIENAELCLLPGGAHCVHLEQSDVFNSVLARFFSKR